MILLDETISLSDTGINYNDISLLMLAIGACLAMIGAVVIYRKWSSGEHNIEKDVMLWAGGILMLMIVRVFIKVMFDDVI